MTPSPEACARSTKRRKSSGVAVEVTGREQIDAVVAPPAAAGELRDRHHLDRGDAEVGERRQMIERRQPGAFVGEGADVHLVQHLPFERATPGHPASVQVNAARIDDLRRPVRAERLEARGGIGKPIGCFAEAIAVQRAGGSARDRRARSSRSVRD